MKNTRIVSMYMRALGDARLPLKVWKKIARVNQIVLDLKLNINKCPNGCSNGSVCSDCPQK